MKRWILMASLAIAAGGLITMQACATAPTMAKAEMAKEADEVKVKLEDCPKAVQETLKKEIGDGKIEDIAMEKEDGKVIYEADAEIGGKDYEIKVSADGRLISKKLEEEKGEHKDEK